MSRPFATIGDNGTPLKVLLVGAGAMGHAWLGAVEASPLVELCGIVDLNLEAARASAASIDKPNLPVGKGTAQLASDIGAQAVTNVTVPAAHHPVSTEALIAGLPVLGEKPAASTVAQGLSLVAAAELTGQLFMVSQSRRYNRDLFAAKALAGGLGRLGILSADFFKAPHFGGFRDQMDHPLLLDMAIHQFDMARFLLNADPVSVFCEKYNPAWSWYRGDAAAVASFEMSGGERFVLNGSWCSPGQETSWKAAWRLGGENGTLLWGGDTPPTVSPSSPDSPAADHAGRVDAGVHLDAAVVKDPGSNVHGSLREFVSAVRTGTAPMGQVHANILSLAMVEAAIESSATGRRVQIDALLERSYEEAVRDEKRQDVAAVLRCSRPRTGPWHGSAQPDPLRNVTGSVQSYAGKPPYPFRYWCVTQA
ncbi:Gfo/Idh/MocA family protein [Paenarthrobacter nitroguajacolicus]|uniref:Gfo/Idh/MocA family protein n=1 Tax=Paenarthrobacter nitroguajacolicus TaxID=211146 RepID=UPI001AEA86C6|nr:Gfo/Idh/MocA family oxidoreductase [Paenarthrobacter nitroguajacolicus]MDR6639537.1 putative dehydrogenase [Paenarthrobacter nitroguajacolicus]